MTYELAANRIKRALAVANGDQRESVLQIEQSLADGILTPREAVQMLREMGL